MGPIPDENSGTRVCSLGKCHPSFHTHVTCMHLFMLIFNDKLIINGRNFLYTGY